MVLAVVTGTGSSDDFGDLGAEPRCWGRSVVVEDGQQLANSKGVVWISDCEPTSPLILSDLSSHTRLQPTLYATKGEGGMHLSFSTLVLEPVCFGLSDLG